MGHAWRETEAIVQLGLDQKSARSEADEGYIALVDCP